MRKGRFVFLALLVSGALLLPLAVSAQRIDGDLRGTVKDPTGAVIPGAKVTVTNEGTGAVREVETTSTGTFHAANLLPGTYSVKVEVSGFRTYVRRGVGVIANRVVEVDISLEIGAAVETVEVVGGAEMVETQTATLAGGSYKGDLLTLGMNAAVSLSGTPMNLAILAPNVTSMPGGVAGEGGSIGGNRPRNNSFTVDGVDNNDPSVTGAVAPVISEAVEEFTLLTNQFAAEYGHSTAGQFIQTTKSGTNEIHGTGWWYLQNRKFNSFDNTNRALTAPGDPKPRYDFNRFGGQAGGPIIKDKLFYFGSYEYRNLTLEGSPTGSIFVPTASGLSTLETLAATAGSGVSPVNVGLLSDHVPAAATATTSYNVCNELTNPTCDPAGAVVAIPVGLFSAVTPVFDRTHLYLVSGDYQTAKWKHSGRYHYSRNRGPNPATLPVPEFNSSIGYDTWRTTYSQVWTPTPTVVNEFRFGYLRAVGTYAVQDVPPPSPTDVFGNYTIFDMSLNIGPQSNLPQSGGDNIYQLVDNITWVKGRHTIKAGVDVRDIISYSNFLPRARGDYVWTADTAGTNPGNRNLSGLDGFVRDLFPTYVSIRGVGSGHFSQNRIAAYWFFQDTWRVHPRLTLDLGLRYEFTETARDQALQNLNGLANLNSLQGHSAFATLSTLHQQALLAHVGDSVVFQKPQSDVNNWAPRVGIAWDVFGDAKTSIRAGIGRGFDVYFGNLPLLQLPPQRQAENRESNACALLPSPAWCAAPFTVGGDPLSNATPGPGLDGVYGTADDVPGSNIRYNTTGFLEGGGLLPVLPLTTSLNAAVARAATGNFVPDEKLPETWTWSLSVQREFWRDWLVEARYVGTHALNLPVQRHLNTGVPAYWVNPSLRLPVFTSVSEVPASFPAGVPTLAAFNTARDANPATAAIDTRMLSPFGFGGAMTMFSPAGRSTYHGASAKVEKRITRESWGSLLLNTAYTWSKTLDLIDNELFTSFVNPRRPFNHYDLSGGKGLSALHRKHKYTFTWLYEFPHYAGDSGALRKLLNGWGFSGTWFLESGQPVTVLSGRDIDGNGDSAGDFAFHNPGGTPGVGSDSRSVCWYGGSVSFACTADSLGLPDPDPVRPGNQADITPYIVGYVSNVDNAEWIRSGLGGEANGGRGSAITDEINSWMWDIGKKTPFWGENRYIEFRVQIVNVFNHPSYVPGSGGIFAISGSSSPAAQNTGFVLPGSPNFLNNGSWSGSLGQTPWQRVIQFALRVVF